MRSKTVAGLASHFAAWPKRLGDLLQSILDALQFQLSVLIPLNPSLRAFVQPGPPAAHRLSPLFSQEKSTDTAHAKDSEWNKPFAHWPPPGLCCRFADLRKLALQNSFSPI